MNDSPNGTLPPAAALHLMALLDGLDPPTPPGQAMEPQDKSHGSYRSHRSYEVLA